MVAIRLDAPITSFTISLTIYFAYGLKTMFKLLIRAYFISALTFGFKKNRVKLSAKSNHFSLAFDLNAMLKLLIKAF